MVDQNGKMGLNRSAAMIRNLIEKISSSKINGEYGLQLDET